MVQLRSMRWVFAAFLSVSSSLLASASPACRLELPGGTFNLNGIVEVGKNTPSAFNFLKEWKESKLHTNVLVAKMKNKKISFKHIDRAEDDEVNLPDIEALALFSFVGEMPTIYVSGGELGIFAAALFHEAVHAMDVDYATSRQELLKQWEDPKISDEETERFEHKMIFAAEKKAYKFQQNLVEEISAKAPCAKAYFEFQDKSGHFIAHKMTDEEIKSTYQLKID